jgi:LPS export ABC transporter protein LptC
MMKAMWFGALLALTSVAACTKKGSAPPVRATSLADSAEQVLFNVHTLMTVHGVQRGELFADTAYVFDENSRFELRKVRATFNTMTGTKDGVMSADRGRYNLHQQTLEGFGNVSIVTTDGRKLTSPRLKYMQGLNEVSSDTNFTLVRPGQTVSGIGFKSDPQLTHFNIISAPKGSGSFFLPGDK